MFLLCAVTPKGLPIQKEDFFMTETLSTDQKKDLAPSRSPLTRSYWKQAAAELKNPRMLVFAALMIAACIALAQVPSIRPFGPDGPRIGWGWIARSICGLVTGPVTALVFGAAEDTVSFFISNRGDPYFPGYMITTMIGTAIYALCLYRQRLTVVRVFMAKLLTNACNVVLGSLWSAILYEKGYIYYATKSLIKNLTLLPVQVIILCLVLAALMPIMSKMHIIPQKGDASKLKVI